MYKLYSERNKSEQELSDVYEYETIPEEFRNQLFFILEDVLDNDHSTFENHWDIVHNRFAREIGVKYLGELLHSESSGKRDIEHFIDNCSTMRLLDFIDFTWHYINGLKEEMDLEYNEDYCQEIDKSLFELNCRFKQNNLGYEYIDGELIRIDNKLLHKVVVKPALYLLNSENFDGAEEEFRKAFELRKKKDNKNSILEALKAFESTMKTICEKKGYAYNAKKNTAKDLISILENNNFYPSYLNNHLTSLRTTLESGLPALRNKNSGHGQGAAVVDIPDEFTEYALHLAATNIVLLVKIYINSK